MGIYPPKKKTKKKQKITDDSNVIEHLADLRSTRRKQYEAREIDGWAVSRAGRRSAQRYHIIISLCAASSLRCARILDAWRPLYIAFRPRDSRRPIPHRRPASTVYASLRPPPDETLDSEDFSDSFDADAAQGGGRKKRSIHAGGRDDMDKPAKNVEDAVNIIGLLRST